MEFLMPVFAAAGALAAGIPFVLHMLRRAPSQTMPFSLVRFLKPTQPRFTRRSKIEHWPLLLLRMLAIALLGLAFARPFFRSTNSLATEEQNGRYITVLIDSSASMKRDGIRDGVIRELESVVDDLRDTDQLKVTFYSQTTNTVIDRKSWAAFSAGERNKAIERASMQYEPDWHQTNTGIALLQAADDLLQTEVSHAECSIVLITDFQEGSDFETLESGAWPAGINVDLRVVHATPQGNASLHTMVDRRTGQTRIRINNDTESITTQHELQPVDRDGRPAGSPVTVIVPPGQQRSLPIPEVTQAENVTSVQLLHDPQSFDNTIRLPASRKRITRLAHVGATDINDEAHMRYYLQRALAGRTDRDDESKFEVIDTVTSDGIVLPISGDIDLAIITDAIPSELAPSLQKLLERGGVIVAALHSPEMAKSLVSFLPQDIAITEATIDDYAMLGRIDFEHPLFADFSESRFADFSSIRFWKHREIELPPQDDSATEPTAWTVVAQFDSGLPAIIRFQHSPGGEVYVLASGWHPDDSQWALSSRFPPMLSRFVDLASPNVNEHRFVQVGDVIRPTDMIEAEEWAITFPDGTTQSSEDVENATVTINLPGEFTVTNQAGSEDKVITLLAELAPSESRTAPLPDGQLYSWGIGSQDSDQSDLSESPADDQSRPATADQLESQQKYWRWFLLAGLGCLFCEAILASVIHRRQPEIV
jgi:hypothetical protein